ncbi:hypothetical protein M0P48_02130 [Candidatus Gracilibacteria bacterium]|nr:hypothetical protein [Candidatus Gracilibacteria bacterium]
MAPKLQQYIDMFGGKHGALEYFGDNHQSLREHLLWQHVFGVRERISERAMDQLKEQCKYFGTSRAILRTSERSDWGGMVDTIPTRKVKLDLKLIDQILEEMRKKLFDPQLLKYAAMENNGYDPEKTTISVSPYIEELTVKDGRRKDKWDKLDNPTDEEEEPKDQDFKGATVTEHPNIQDGLTSDIAFHGEYGDEGPDWFCANNILGEKVFSPWIEAYPRTSLKLLETIRKFRETGALPEDRALQYEFVIHPISKTPLLVQIRDFAQKKPFEMDEYEAKTALFNRLFGIPMRRQELPLNLGLWRDSFLRFEEENPNTPYAHIHESRTNLSLEEFPANMRVYLQNNKPALSHANTRFVKLCLEREGFSTLTDYGVYSNTDGALREMGSKGIRRRTGRLVVQRKKNSFLPKMEIEL